MPKFTDELDPDIRNILLAQIRNLWTHASTALEGNSLTLGDTAFVLEEGLTISGKPIKDHEEVIGHARAIDLIYGMLDRNAHIREPEISALHKAVQTEVVMDIYQPVGAWKKESNYTNYIDQDGKQKWREYPRPEYVPHLMAEWMQKLNSQDTQRQCPEKNYADLHLEFVCIHPFADGNGRMARLLSNVPILRSGLPPIVVPKEARREYIKTLSDYQQTVPNLADLKQLSDLPNNPQRERFHTLCKGFWKPIMELLQEAKKKQLERDRRKKRNAVEIE
ncbi:Fic family protein [Acidithiobacillus acidisediminis]|uniref:Fic family protein n=1 Tax=Acidithiobacillus acidisediminis TaxID=2937799 RepID=UPI00200F372C|nr:Fic family protein [Acidithiobacillus sp. S30A2]